MSVEIKLAEIRTHRRRVPYGFIAELLEITVIVRLCVPSHNETFYAQPVEFLHKLFANQLRHWRQQQ